jgi:hypothetical protein
MFIHFVLLDYSVFVIKLIQGVDIHRQHTFSVVFSGDMETFQNV